MQCLESLVVVIALPVFEVIVVVEFVPSVVAVIALVSFVPSITGNMRSVFAFGSVDTKVLFVCTNFPHAG